VRVVLDNLADGALGQNHRMVGVGRHLCGSSSPTPLLKQGHLQQPAQDHVQMGLEYLQRRRLHSLPGQPVPVLRHPQREEVLPHVPELPMPQFMPVAPCPVAGHHWKEFVDCTPLQPCKEGALPETGMVRMEGCGCYGYTWSLWQRSLLWKVLVLGRALDYHQGST